MHARLYWQLEPMSTQTMRTSIIIHPILEAAVRDRPSICNANFALHSRQHGQASTHWVIMVPHHSKLLLTTTAMLDCVIS